MGLKKLVIVSCILTIFPLHSMLASSMEVDDEKEFSYDKHDESGPDNWDMIHEDWELCGKGKMQSPIDLNNDRVTLHPDFGDLKQSYHSAPAILKNRGHDIMLKWEDNAGSIWINGTEYFLKQLHWHSPSEHTVNGRRYALELHMVHLSAEEKIAVVGILFRLGSRNPFLVQIAEKINTIIDLKEDEEKVGPIDPSNITSGCTKYYRYMGSLTTPPCTEGVIWTIVKKPSTVTKEQVNLLKEAVHDEFEWNARPLQN